MLAVAILQLCGSLLVAQTHAGQPVPEFVHGDECLFCHRTQVGTSWKANRHGNTVKQKEDAPALAERLKPPTDVTHFLGSRDKIRILKKDGYGRFSIDGDKEKFGERCAGCHATGVEAATKTFQYFGIDCYACHGVVDLNHSSDTSLVWLSKKRRSDARAITSICAQCHLRGDEVRSKTTGRPYPDNFVAGDNLFLDLQANFNKADDQTLNAGDRHVYRNVRDVLEKGSETTCLSCHRIHGDGSRKHRLVLTNESCLDCHNAEGPKRVTKPYTVKSTLCEY
jgi:hypothetical protein